MVNQGSKMERKKLSNEQREELETQLEIFSTSAMLVRMHRGTSNKRKTAVQVDFSAHRNYLLDSFSEKELDELAEASVAIYCSCSNQSTSLSGEISSEQKRLNQLLDAMLG